jgi:CheY-like chemotaxis protein
VHADEVPLVHADATLIQQVIINLATNSMQAMQGREGRVDITLDKVLPSNGLVDRIPFHHPTQSNQVVRIIVADNGCGMDATVKDRIFEPFFTTKRVGEGTGLGLSVVHGIVTSHGGSISVESQPGRGASFTICLPSSSSHEKTESYSKEAISEIVVKETDPKPKEKPHILVVDDDEPVLTSLKFLLENFGYLVSDYTNSLEALEAFSVDPFEFELVLVDYNMPGMSGVEMASKLRSLHKEVPIAITSGYIDLDLRSQAATVGVNDIIPKPCEIGDLKAIVNRLLSQ